MRTTVDIPDPIYRELKARAAREGTSVKELILKGVNITLKSDAPAPKRKGKLEFPMIRSKNPGSLKLGPEGVYEYIPFP
jgi:hypothetical protein